MVSYYFCMSCKYHTEILSHFKRHLQSSNHSEKSNVSLKNIENFNNFKTNLFFCNKCDNIYVSKNSLIRHQKTHREIIGIDQITNENITLKQELENAEKQLENKEKELKIKDKQLDKALDVAKVNSKTANTTTNMLKYAQLHYRDAEPLQRLTGDDLYNVIKYKNPKNKETTNETYIKTAIYNYTHGIFTNFVGNMIIEHYKPKIKNEANLIATDTSRLSFIIMQKIAEKKEWISDKSGKKFTELVLTPVIDAIKGTLTAYINFKNTKEVNEKTLELMTKCLELKRDIEVEKFTKQILRYVSPSFHFDNLKLLDDDVNNSNDDSLSEDAKPIKIITKKNK